MPAPTPDELAAWPDSDLEAHRRALVAEQGRRKARADVAAQAATVRTQMLDAIGREDGQPWQAPPSPLLHYTTGDQVTDAGRRWRAEQPVVLERPGANGGWADLGPIA